jgi:hypothetical protein
VLLRALAQLVLVRVSLLAQSTYGVHLRPEPENRQIAMDVVLQR